MARRRRRAVPAATRAGGYVPLREGAREPSSRNDEGGQTGYVPLRERAREPSSRNDEGGQTGYVPLFFSFLAGGSTTTGSSSSSALRLAADESVMLSSEMSPW